MNADGGRARNKELHCSGWSRKVLACFALLGMSVKVQAVVEVHLY